MSLRISMFLILDISEANKIIFHYLLDKKFVQRGFAVDRRDSILIYLDKLLKELDVKLKNIEYLGVVVGSGGFTSTRLAVTVANALAYALKIPVVGVAKNWDADEVIKKAKNTPVGQYLIPTYSGEANIGKKKS